MRTQKLVAALTIAGAMSLASYAPAYSAPITPLSAAAKPLAQDTVQVRWGGGWHGGGGHGWHGGGGGWGWGVGALAAGALIGAAISAPYYGGNYPGYGYGYGNPYYGYSDPYYGNAGYYPAYSYYRPHRRYYAGYRPYWGRSYGMYRVHHYRHYRRW